MEGNYDVIKINHPYASVSNVEYLVNSLMRNNVVYHQEENRTLILKLGYTDTMKEVTLSENNVKRMSAVELSNTQRKAQQVIESITAFEIAYVKELIG
jgi:hypothetical protein